jgi:hypothetical protein
MLESTTKKFSLQKTFTRTNATTEIRGLFEGVSALLYDALNVPARAHVCIFTLFSYY